MKNTKTISTKVAKAKTASEVKETVNLSELKDINLALSAKEALVANKTSMNSIVKIAIADISVNSGPRRVLNKDAVSDIESSFKNIGQINAIIVDNKGNLVAGWHRLQAAKNLEWTEISAVVIDSNIDVCEAIKIDENVCRAELTEFQLCEYLYRGYIVHKKLNPEAYAGTNQHTKRAEAILFNEKHVEKMMTELGISRTTYYEKLGIAKRVSPEAKNELKRLGATQDSDLYKDLAKITPLKQLELISMNYDKKTLKDEAKKLATPPEDAETIAKSTNIEAKKAVKIIEFNENKDEIIAKLKNYGIVFICETKGKENIIKQGNTLIRTYKTMEQADAFLEGYLSALELSKPLKSKAI